MSSEQKINGELLDVEERFELKGEQAVGLRDLFNAKKRCVEDGQQIDAQIDIALRMIGIGGREIIRGELADDDPYLIIKSSSNGVII
jgi:hypothetical protein